MPRPTPPPDVPEQDRSPIPGVLGRIGGLVVGGLFLFGAFAKIIDPDAFADQIAGQGLDFLLPAGAIVFLALALEIGLGVALVMNVRTTGVLIASSLLVAFFLALTGYHYYLYATGSSAAPENCGCFGNILERSPEVAFWMDMATLFPGMILCWFGRPRFDEFTPMWKVLTISGTTLGGLIFTWVAPSLDLDDFATRLKPGTELTELCAGEGEDKACLLELVYGLEDDPEVPGERMIVVIADPHDKSIHDPLNEHVMEGRQPDLIVLSKLSKEEIADLEASELAPSFPVFGVPQVLLRPLYRALPRSFLVEDGKVKATHSGLPPAGWLQSVDE